MFEKEEVINWLRNCDGHAIHTGHGCEKCPFLEGTESGEECVERLHASALELLKEQEPVESKTGKWITRLRHEHYPSGKPYEEDFCSECGKRGSLEYPFCPWCGKKMESGEVG